MDANTQQNFGGGKSEKSLLNDDNYIFQQLHKKEILQNIELEKGRFYPKNYQIYVDRVFQLYSDKLRWFICDFSMGSGKTLIALNILKNLEGRFIVVGNEASQGSFAIDAQKIDIDLDKISQITVQRVAQLTDIELINYFSDSYIIIDEFQKCYSQQGLNSYGLAFKKLFKHQLKKCKVICLTGTMFNATTDEIRFILDIFQEKITGTMEQMTDILANHTISWNVENKQFFAEKRQQGIPDKQIIKQFPLVRCEMGKKQYEAYLESTKEEGGLLSSTKFLLPKYYYDGEKHKANEILTGVYIQKSTLKETSPISYFFIDKMHKILKQKTLKKSAAYLDNINSQFGLLQYLEILNENGFILYGKKPTGKTLCSVCGKELQEHDKEEKYHYKPAAYGVYSNNITVQQRDYFVQAYNANNNKYGEEMCLMMLTAIAQTGLSLFCVTNFFVLDNIPEISLYNQIVARAIRLKGHMDLYEDERYVNVYALTVSAPGFKKITKHEQKWIDIYEEDVKIQKLYDKLRDRDFNAAIILEKQKKVEISEQYKERFVFQILPYVVDYISQLKIPVIPLEQMLGILKNDTLVPFGFSLESFDDRLLTFIIRYIYMIEEYIHPQTKKKTQMCYASFIQERYTHYYRNRIQQFPPISYSKYTPITIDKIEEKNIFQQLNSTNNTNHLGYYIKTFILQGIKMEDEFYNNKNFTAFMIWDNLVYIEGDEINYVQNHLPLYKEIYNKDIYYIKDNIKTLIKKYKIIGFYQGNDVICKEHQKQKKQIRVANKFVDDSKIVQFYISSSIPSFKYISGQQSRDCIARQPQFSEVFQDESFYKLKDYESQIQYYKCRYVLYYALFSDKIQLPEFLI